MAVGEGAVLSKAPGVAGTLEREPLNINEIAERMKIPPSSAAMHVKTLEEAGLIETILMPGIRGSMKVCKKRPADLLFPWNCQRMNGSGLRQLVCRWGILWITMWNPPAALWGVTALSMRRMSPVAFTIQDGPRPSSSGSVRGTWNTAFPIPGWTRGCLRG